MNIRSTTLLTSTLVAMLLSSCSKNDIAGNGTQTGNPVIAGKLYEPDGKKPASGATVHVRPKNLLPDALGKRSADTSTVYTNSEGRFEIASIDPGTYTIESVDKNNNMALADSVVVSDQVQSVTLQPDTLKPAGSITGTVTLSEGGDFEKIYVLVFGIDRFTTVTAEGKFTIANVAEGSYALRVVSGLPEYDARDTSGVAVASGATTAMPVINPPFIGTPTIKSMSAAFDSLLQTVEIRWNYLDSSKTAGVNIYRKNISSDSSSGDTTFKAINSNPVKDSVFEDQTVLSNRSYAYCLSVVKTDGGESAKSSILFVTTSGSVFRTMDTLAFTIRRSDDRMGHQSIAASKGDTLYVLDDSTPTVQMLNAELQLLRQIGHDSLTNPYGVAVSNGDGSVYVAEKEGDPWCFRSIFMFGADGSFIKRIHLSAILKAPGGETAGVTGTQFTVDNRNHLIIVNDRQDSVFVCDTAGILLKKFGVFSSTTVKDQKCLIYSIVTDSENNIYLWANMLGFYIYNADADFVRLLSYDSIIVTQFVGVNTPGPLVHVPSFAVDPVKQRIYLCDNDLHMIGFDGRPIASCNLDEIPSGVFLLKNSFIVTSYIIRKMEVTLP